MTIRQNKVECLSINTEFFHEGRRYVKLPEMIFQVDGVGAVRNCAYIVHSKDDYTISPVIMDFFCGGTMVDEIVSDERYKERSR